MAYQYFQQHAVNYLVQHIKKWSHNVRHENINQEVLVDQFSFEELYYIFDNMGGLIDCIINPVLNIYGVEVIHSDDVLTDIYNGRIQWHTLFFRDLNERINGETSLVVKIFHREFYHVDIDIFDKGICYNPMNLLLDPLAFFQEQEASNSGEFIMRIVSGNTAHYTKMFWIIGYFCQMYLVPDIAVEMRLIVMALLKRSVSSQ